MMAFMSYVGDFFPDMSSFWDLKIRVAEISRIQLLLSAVAIHCVSAPCHQIWSPESYVDLILIRNIVGK